MLYLSRLRRGCKNGSVSPLVVKVFRSSSSEVLSITSRVKFTSRPDVGGQRRKLRTLKHKRDKNMFAMNWHIYWYLRARRALSIFKEVQLRTRMTLSLYNFYGDSPLLVLNGSVLNSDNALLVFIWRVPCPKGLQLFPIKICVFFFLALMHSFSVDYQLHTWKTMGFIWEMWKIRERNVILFSSQKVVRSIFVLFQKRIDPRRWKLWEKKG